MIPARIAGGCYCASAEGALLGVILSGERLLEGQSARLAGMWGYGVGEVHKAAVREAGRADQRAGKLGMEEEERKQREEEVADAWGLRASKRRG